MRNVSRKPAEADVARLGALSRLPVFFDLTNKRTIIAGGGAGAAWKAELLAASGAHVDVIAPEFGDEMLALFARGAAAGSLFPIVRHWSKDDFRDCAIAVGDFEIAAEAEAFRLAGRAAGVPVNTIDKPETCDFQFGTIVNRSPVVIGISTSGAAPILGQTVRQKIETMLPRALAEWGALARDLRDRVMGRLRQGAERRKFWEDFTVRAFSGTETLPDAETAERLIDAACLGSRPAGCVTLVGAGPGDPDLLTLKAMRALQSADVILFDDLVSAEVLELARREAKRMLVGKRGARESCRQDDINALMLKLAKQGKRVVRLKAGDPMIFGRAGEEIAALEAEGIPVEVIPGITAAQGLAARLNVSLTHRDHAQSLTLMTGHSRKGELPDTIDWRNAADPHATTVFYMGARRASGIVEQLRKHGLAEATPAVAMANVSRPEQAYWTGPMRELAAGVATLPVGAPVIIGIGPAFGEIRDAAGRSGQSAAAIHRALAAGGPVPQHVPDLHRHSAMLR